MYRPDVEVIPPDECSLNKYGTSVWGAFLAKSVKIKSRFKSNQLHVDSFQVLFINLGYFQQNRFETIRDLPKNFELEPSCFSNLTSSFVTQLNVCCCILPLVVCQGQHKHPSLHKRSRK